VFEPSLAVAPGLKKLSNSKSPNLLFDPLTDIGAILVNLASNSSFSIKNLYFFPISNSLTSDFGSETLASTNLESRISIIGILALIIEPSSKNLF
jgi:hypothetical protein